MDRFYLAFVAVAALVVSGCTQTVQYGTSSNNTNSMEWSNNMDGTAVWNNAVSYCENLSEGGYDDWRLPTKDELEKASALDYYNRCTFLTGWYWSSVEDDESNSFSTYFGGCDDDTEIMNGYSSGMPKNTARKVRCIRGGSGGGPAGGNVDVAIKIGSNFPEKCIENVRHFCGSYSGADVITNEPIKCKSVYVISEKEAADAMEDSFTDDSSDLTLYMNYAADAMGSKFVESREFLQRSGYTGAEPEITDMVWESCGIGDGFSCAMADCEEIWAGYPDVCPMIRC